MKIILKFNILIVFLWSNLSLAEMNISLKEWKEEYVKSNRENLSFAVIEGVEKNGLPVPSLVQFEKEIGFLKPVDLTQSIWDFRLNNPPHLSKKKSIRLEEFAVSSGVNLILDVSKKDWVLSFLNDKKISTQNTFAGAESKEVEVVREWLDSQFGYNGIVLDFRNNHILVANLLNNFKSNRMQALALANSASKMFLTKKSSGLGLFALVEKDGYFAVFKVIMLEKGVSNIEKGTKLIFEQTE